MSSTTNDETPESSPLQNKLALAQKKLKVLKNALKLERVEKTNVEKEIEIAMKSIEQLKNVISEKVCLILITILIGDQVYVALSRKRKSSGSITSRI